ncbi:hypothetical protein PQB77_gp32 [Arthrobacter phage Correa]|uniref:Uncharacterized protein n=2 Tax=Mudcatvirus TaxID=1982088 RepID=A0A222ZIN1_9CAUD|nr:hypothetical protein PQB76_gp034 [Arthrobacter phage Cheesy]YP_010666320.1 hypothetical protein PQB77_gp32 [Arthrobacter phage Correa]ASR80093.1 hypothetical protein SEA_CORREA_32 [Arthrobacter phage Correa]ASR84614.1 hypothetical protein SEA_CHEESY_34 [Arthrobacter phage Cheesy]
METEEIETTEEENESTSATEFVVQVAALAALAYTGYRLGKLTEYLVKTGLEHRRQKKVAKQEEK